MAIKTNHEFDALDDDDGELHLDDGSDGGSELVESFDHDDTLSIEGSDYEDLDFEEDSDSLFNFIPLDPPVHDTALIENDNIHYIWAPFGDIKENIRLMVLQSAEQFDDPIVFSMEVVPLENTRHYEALSYAWGGQLADGSHLTESIHCYGHPADREPQRSRPLKVTSNLFQALQRLRQGISKGRDLRLWVDARLNQENNEERSAQVRIMDKIYSIAASTNIWLGEPSAVEERTLLQELLKLDGSDGHRTSAHPTQQSLRQIFDSSWFQRRWTLQEFVMSSHKVFLMGESSFTPEFLVLTARTAGLPLPPIFQHKARVDHWGLVTTHGTRPLLDSLVAFREARCSVVHDYVFALLALSVDRGQVKVDYTVGVDELFRNIAKYYIEQNRQVPDVYSYYAALAVLVWAAHSSCGPRSWVPDWTQMAGDISVAESAVGALATFRAKAIHDHHYRGYGSIEYLPRGDLLRDECIKFETLIFNNAGDPIRKDLTTSFDVSDEDIALQLKAIAADLSDEYFIAWLPVPGVAWVLRQVARKPDFYFELVSNLALKQDLATTSFEAIWSDFTSTIYLI